MTHPYFDLPRPVVIGHRGCAGEVPENTLASFEAGLAAGAAILESDVHVSRDGVPVLIHDDVVDRVTDGSGPVADLDLAELSRLDAGHRFERDGRHPFRGRGLRIPTLEQALRTFPAARFNLELNARDFHIIERATGAKFKYVSFKRGGEVARRPQGASANFWKVWQSAGTRPRLTENVHVTSLT